MNFKLSEEAQSRLARYRRDVERFREMSEPELHDKAQYYLDNCTQNHRRGECVYDSVMWYVIVPELIRRLDNARDD